MTDYLTLEEVAVKLQLSTMTIRRLVKRDSFPCVKLGHSLRFNPRNVDLWLQRREMSKEWRSLK